MIPTVSAREAEAIERASDELRRVFVAYPSYRLWLLDETKVPDGPATFRVWAKMLAGVPATNLTLAVDRILSGEVPVPEAYARDQLPTAILAECRRIASAKARSVAMRSKHEHLDAQREAKANRAGCKFAHSMTELFREGNRLDELHARGELTDDEHRAAKSAWRDKINTPAIQHAQAG